MPPARKAKPAKQSRNAGQQMWDYAMGGPPGKRTPADRADRAAKADRSAKRAMKAANKPARKGKARRKSA